MRRMLTKTGFVLYSLAMALIIASACRPRLAAAPTREPVTLRFAYRSGTGDMQPLLDAFMAEYPWITVEVQEYRRDSELELGLDTGSIDVFRSGREALDYAQQDLLKPLDDIHLAEWAPIRDDYVEGTWEVLKIQGQQWGVPAGLDMLVVYVHADHAKALALSLPESDWTLFDFTELAGRMNYPDGPPYNASMVLFGFCSDPANLDPAIFVYLYGGRIVDDLRNPTRPTLDDPLTVEAVTWYVDLFHRHQVAPTPRKLQETRLSGYRQVDNVPNAIGSGFCGMWLGWYSNGAELDRRGIRWRMLPLPYGRDRVGMAEVEGYFIAKNCPYPSQALRLLRFLSDRWQAAGRLLPPRRSLAQAGGYQSAVGEKVSLDALLSGRVLTLPTEQMPLLAKVGQALIVAVNTIIEEELDPEDVLAETQKRVKAEFVEP